MSTREGNSPQELPGRRTVLGFLLGSSLVASLGAIFYPILKFVLPPKSGELDTHTVVAARADELAFRRQGLGLSLLAIAFVVFSLWRLIRYLERGKPGGESQV